MKDKTPKIIAVDFDGTLCTNAYPEIGEPIPYSLLYVTRAKAAGTLPPRERSRNAPVGVIKTYTTLPSKFRATSPSVYLRPPRYAN